MYSALLYLGPPAVLRVSGLQGQKGERGKQPQLATLAHSL